MATSMTTSLALTAALLAALSWNNADANMYDLIDPRLVPPSVCGPSGCAAWNSLNATIDSWWLNGMAPQKADNYCAQLPFAPALSKPAPLLDPSAVGGQGAWCVCADDAAKWGYCTSANQVPEQVNIQVASPDTVVVSFVTFESIAPGEPPSATIKVSGSSGNADVKTGVTHTYVTPTGDRTYYFHFVVLDGLESSQKYEYAVQSGGKGAPWSKPFVFTSPPGPEGPTSVAIFGDMGVYSWTNLGNMLSQAEAGEISAVVHIGDHCYNIGGDDSRRGDGYMQAYEPVVSQIPFLPVVGNHEFYDGQHLGRYLNQTDGTVVANPPQFGASSTATSALGYGLSAGNHHAAGVHAAVPSGTSRFYSVDVGLIHFIALDLNMYNAVDDCGETCREAQLAWLEKDLASAQENRDKVPWIVAMSHFPLYCSNCPAPGSEPGAWWNSEICEFYGHDQSCTAGGVAPKFASPNNNDMVPDFEPLFMKYGVDVYASGHVYVFFFCFCFTISHFLF